MKTRETLLKFMSSAVPRAVGTTAKKKKLVSVWFSAWNY